MYDSKYKVDFHFKELSYKKIEEIIKIIDLSEGFKICRIATSRKIKQNGIVHLDKREFKNSKDLLKYLNSNVKYLDALEFVLLDSRENEVWLKYIEIYGRWELTYNKKTMEIDGFILNIRNVFKRNIFDFYIQNKFVIFWSIYGLQVLGGKILTTKATITYTIDILLIISMLFLLLKRKPYRNYKFINKNKDEIILNIFFYLLGILTSILPNIIKYLLK